MRWAKRLTMAALIFYLFLAAIAQAAIQDDLVVLYQFENSGNLGENSVGTDGAVHDGPLGSAPGLIGNAADFDDTGKTIRLEPYAALSPGSGGASVAFWFKSSNADRMGLFIAHEESPFPGTGAWNDGDQFGSIFEGPTVAWRYHYDMPTHGQWYPTHTDPFDGQWHSLVTTVSPHDGVNGERTLNAYWDGQPAGSQVISSHADLIVQSLVLGAGYADTLQSSWDADLDGLVDDFAYWTREVGAAEALDIYNNGLQGVGIPIPEPATLMLVGLGGLGLLRRRKR